MDTQALPLKEKSAPGSSLPDLVIEKGLIALLIFTPLAFGTVQRWSQSLMEAAAFTLLGVWLVKKFLYDPPSRLPGNTLLIPMALFALFAVIQIIPLPEGILARISPNTVRFYESFMGEGASGPMTISVSPGATLEELLKFLSYAAIFFITADCCRTKERASRILRTVIYMGAALTVFAVIQKMTWNGRLYWFYPLGSGVPDGHPVWGPYINRNHFAGYMELAIPIALGFVLYRLSMLGGLSGASPIRGIFKLLNSRRILPAAITSAAALVMAAGLFMTLSKGGIIGLAVSIFVFGVLAWTRRSLRRPLKIIIALVAAMSMIVALALITDVQGRFLAMATEGFTRLDVWMDSLKMLRDHPFFGIGLGAFNDAFMGYQTKWPLIHFEHAESDYVELAVETGLLGLLTTAAMATAFFHPIFSAWKGRAGMYAKCMAVACLSALSALLVHGFTDFNLRIPANALTFTVIAAVACAAFSNAPAPLKAGAASPARQAPAGTRRTALTALIIIFTGALLYLPVTGLIAERCHGRAYAILDDRTTERLDLKGISKETLPDYTAALRSIEKAIALSPTRANYYKDLSDLHATLAIWADAMESAGARTEDVGLSKADNYKKAVAYMKEAVRLQPSNPDYRFALGKLYLAVAPISGLADREFQAALLAYPVNAAMRFSVAMQYLINNRPREAMAHARALAEIDDSYVIADPEKRAFVKETDAPQYRMTMSRSYLAKAYEIAWRASGKDINAVRRIIPSPDKHPQAEDVFQLFLEAKGLDDR